MPKYNIQYTLKCLNGGLNENVLRCSLKAENVAMIRQT